MKTKIEKLSLKGAGLSFLKGKPLYVWNALPGEVVEIEILKRKRTYFEAVAKNILEPSPLRVPPKEEHFLSCSPWQIIKEEKENDLKKELTKNFLKEELNRDIEIEFEETQDFFF